MARRRWPTVLKARGQIARRQLVSEVAQKEQDVPARLVRERSKDRLRVGCRGPSHANKRLASRLTISQIQNNRPGAPPRLKSPSRTSGVQSERQVMERGGWGVSCAGVATPVRARAVRGPMPAIRLSEP